MAKARKTGKQKPASAKAAKTIKAKTVKPAAASKPTAETEVAASSIPRPKTPGRLTVFGLNTWNKWLAALYGAQGLAILILSATHTFPVTTTYLNADPIASELAGHPVLAAATKHLFDVNMAVLIAIFFFISAVAHLVVATVYRNQYERDVQQGVNKIRWLDYGLSASTMLVAIGFLSGIADLSSLLMIFALSLVMNLTSLAAEVYNQGKATPSWLVQGIGCVAGIVPWLVFAVYAWGAGVYGSRVPAFVYWIYGSMVVMFGAIALAKYLQYKKKGKWADNLYGERVYMVLSLVAKTALAWQIFAGILRP